MRVNQGPGTPTSTTHEGAPARHLTPEQELRRTVMACLLFESTFYESGESVADRIRTLVPTVAAEKVAAMAVEARSDMHLRHVPLLLVREMARHATHKHLVADTLEKVIQRPDELAEFLAIYWMVPAVPAPKRGRTTMADRLREKVLKAAPAVPFKKTPLSAQVKKGLARAFTKFNAYSLAKYNRDNPVKLRDVMFLTHVKPLDGRKGFTKMARRAKVTEPNATSNFPPVELTYREVVLKQLTEGTLPTPDTWEVQLSAGKDKKATWTRLIQENKLGGFALIRNLRNMIEVGVDEAVVREALCTMSTERILPFRFLAALQHAPRFAGELETAMLKNLEGQPKLRGITLLLVDVSGSMDDKISAKSDLRRVDAAAGLAILAREMCASARILTFSDRVIEVPAFRGLGLVKAIQQSQDHGSTQLGLAVKLANTQTYDRLIVITDEQSHDRVPPPGQGRKAYVINVASHQPGVGYAPYVHIDGWSERVLDYIRELERQEAR